MKRFNQDDWDVQATPAQIKEIGLKADRGEFTKRHAQAAIWGVNPWIVRDSFNGDFMMVDSSLDQTHRDDIVDFLFKENITIRSAAKEMMSYDKYHSDFQPARMMFFREITPRQLGFSKKSLSYASIMERWLTLGFLNTPAYMAPGLIKVMKNSVYLFQFQTYINVGMDPICHEGGFDHIFYWTVDPENEISKLEAITCITNVIGSPVAFGLDDKFIVRIPS